MTPRLAGRLVLAAAALLAALPAATTAQAQNFPSRPLKIIVPYAPGGGTDVLARLVGQALSTTLAQPVVVDNRPGGAANIGAEAVAKSPPDGYTLLVENSNFAMTAGMYPHLSFDKATDFIPVALIGSVPVILIANPQSPVHSVAELIRLAREKPGSLAYASCGNGAPQHLAGELFKHMEHLDITHVPYKGCAPALADVVSGQIPIGFNTAANALPYIRSGRVRALAIAGATRYAQTPEVPTLIESGLPGFDVDQWFGFFAPAHTPPEVIRTLHEAINATVAIPDIRNRMNGQGFTPLSTTQAAFDKQVHEDIIRWTRFTREADIRAD